MTEYFRSTLAIKRSLVSGVGVWVWALGYYDGGRWCGRVMIIVRLTICYVLWCDCWLLFPGDDEMVTTTKTTTASTYNDRNLEITIMPFHCDPFSLIIEFYFIKFKLCVYFFISIFHSFRWNMYMFFSLTYVIAFISHIIYWNHIHLNLSSKLS